MALTTELMSSPAKLPSGGGWKMATSTADYPSLKVSFRRRFGHLCCEQWQEVGIFEEVDLFLEPWRVVSMVGEQLAGWGT